MTVDDYRDAGKLDDRRAAIVAEALSWVKTPWHHMAKVKGQGVDCAQFLICVYAELGHVPPIDTGNYSHDWHLHRDERRFLDVLLQHADPVPEGLPGDVAMFDFGRQAAHGAIVIEWPRIVHAYYTEGMVLPSDVSTNLQLSERFAGFYRLKSLA